jgi:hypothetical protein
MPSDVVLHARLAVLETIVVFRLGEAISRMSEIGRQKYREAVIGDAILSAPPEGIDKSTWIVEIRRSAARLITDR